jgi:polyferredoxin
MTPLNSETEDTEPEIQLFEAQKKVYPRDVVGRYRRLKWFFMAICLGLYYFTPFLRWDRGPNVPDQAILIDLPNRRAYFFMIEIWPQEVYYIAGILDLRGGDPFLCDFVAGACVVRLFLLSNGVDRYLLQN